MTRSDVREEVRRWRRGDVLVVVAALSLGAVLAWIVLSIEGMTQDSKQKTADIAALSQQVRGLGATPVAGPSGSPGRAGASGAVGPRGPRGSAGASGKPAPTITPKPGASGASGAPGKPGADSTVAGPSGAVGPSSTVAGPAGASGAPGKDGRDGVDGKDGQPPAGWSWQWTDPLGVTHHYDCERTADSPDSAPRYDCPETTPSSPSPSAPANPQAGLLPLAALVARRRKHAGDSAAVEPHTGGRHRAARGGAHR